MSEGASLPSEFNALVRDALAHLYDQAHLENHPLAAMLDAPAANLDRASRAQKLRRELLDCIETLKPQGRAPSDAARAYAILSYRYLDGLAMPTVAKSLALSRRQVYREHEKGIKAVARLLWDRMGAPRSPIKPGVVTSPASARPLSIAQAEVSRLQQAVHPEPLDLRETLSGVVQLLQPVSQQRGIRLTMPSVEQWPQIVGSRTLLRQAFVNLLSYVLKLVQGDVVIRVMAVQGGCVVEVQGTSPVSGLPATKMTTGDADVGLAVACSLIDAQGGRLEISQGDDIWTGRVWLPVSRSATLLVIDDNADIVALFRRYLGGYDVSVVSTASGEQALRLAAELQPDVITLDVMMPDVDGWEILQRLKATPTVKHIPVIICSVLNEPQLAQAMGASDYISKPVSQERFLQSLRRWLMPSGRTTLP